jgi:phenylalanine-4-hydroxylase
MPFPSYAFEACNTKYKDMKRATNPDSTEFLAEIFNKNKGNIPRGDYSKADADYVMPYDQAIFTPQHHALWRDLYQRQAKMIPDFACEEFIKGWHLLDAADGVPNIQKASDILFKKTGWRLVVVPGLIPDLIFFKHLSQRQFPITCWLREPHESECCVEPDIFHDFTGHLPMLLDPVFADQMNEVGKVGLKTLQFDNSPYLSRLYWYTVETGLIKTGKGLRAYGAGLLSAPGELTHCLGSIASSQTPHHVPFDMKKVMTTSYDQIHSYQDTYFFIDNFQQLFDEIAKNSLPTCMRLKAEENIFPSNG